MNEDQKEISTEEQTEYSTEEQAKIMAEQEEKLKKLRGGKLPPKKKPLIQRVVFN